MLGSAKACQSVRACEGVLGCFRKCQSMKGNADDDNTCYKVPRDCYVPSAMACQDVSYVAQYFYAHGWT